MRADVLPPSPVPLYIDHSKYTTKWLRRAARRKNPGGQNIWDEFYRRDRERLVLRCGEYIPRRREAGKLGYLYLFFGRGVDVGEERYFHNFSLLIKKFFVSRISGAR